MYCLGMCANEKVEKDKKEEPRAIKSSMVNRVLIQFIGYLVLLL